MAKRTHELLLSGDAQSYDRLGIRYTEGSRTADLFHPDSQHSEQVTRLSWEELRSLQNFLEEVVPIMEGTQEDPE